MSDFPGGDQQIQIAQDEHDKYAAAKRVIFALLDTTNTLYLAPSVFKGSSANAMIVALGDPTTGSPISVKNPSDLADGTLTTTPTTIFTAPSKTWVTKIRMRNTGASTRVVTLGYVGSGTTKYPWPAVSLLTHESVDYLAEEGTLGMTSGNHLIASQDAGADVDFIVTGESL